MVKQIFGNHINITFNISGVGDNLTKLINPVNAIAKKHNAQLNLFQNKSSYKTDKNGNIMSPQLGNSGGTITFHSHSCDINEAADELVVYLQSIGLRLNEVYQYNETTRELIKL